MLFKFMDGLSHHVRDVVFASIASNTSANQQPNVHTSAHLNSFAGRSESWMFDVFQKPSVLAIVEHVDNPPRERRWEGSRGAVLPVGIIAITIVPKADMASTRRPAPIDVVAARRHCNWYTFLVIDIKS